ncbi:TA2R7 protein, partial [Bucorvus abyssinicus]|nr:TA2R7 protein [Bucorvus abyssinicus]
SPDKFNATSYDAMAMAIVTLQAFAGMGINAFIVSVLCVAWVKKKSFNSNEKILMFLGCSRFWYFCIALVHSFLSVIYSSCFYVHPIPQLFATIQFFFNSCNTWVSSCLCGFYCIKIANFRHTFFIYLKAKIDRIVPRLLLASVLLSLLMGILGYDIMDRLFRKSFNSTKPENLWKQNIGMDEHLYPLVFTSGFILSMAFTAVAFFALLLLFSLWRHKRKMQATSGKDLSMEAHIKAMKSIVFFFFVYSINFTCLILSLVYVTKMDVTVAFLILILQYALPGVHSLSLIFSNPHMEKTLLRTLACVKCKVCMR